MTLTEFLLTRIAEDEAAARAASSEGAYPHYGDTAAEECVQMARSEGCAEAGVAHLDRWLPARVLAECEAKRRIVEMHSLDEDRDTGLCIEDAFTYPCETLRWLGLPYADHPDYRDEWRPTT